MNGNRLLGTVTGLAALMLASSLPAVIQGIPRSAPVVASAVADPAGIHRDALLWLADLIRINTSNPPGSEQLAAKYVAGVLQKEGIKPELLDLALGRSAVVARLRSSVVPDPSKALLLVDRKSVV